MIDNFVDAFANGGHQVNEPDKYSQSIFPLFSCISPIFPLPDLSHIKFYEQFFLFF
jgi:hypothetical protein